MNESELKEKRSQINSRITKQVQYLGGAACVSHKDSHVIILILNLK